MPVPVTYQMIFLLLRAGGHPVHYDCTSYYIGTIGSTETGRRAIRTRCQCIREGLTTTGLYLDYRGIRTWIG